MGLAASFPPLDGIYLSLIKNELSKTLVGSRVDKIHQPSRESLVITLRTQGFGAKKLMISSSAGTARLHFTEREPENPKVPPMFCMLLRKHIGAGKLIAIRQDGFERILFLDFEATDEFGDRVTLTLAVEIMGRCSNILLISQERGYVPGQDDTAGDKLYPAAERRPFESF